VAVCVGGDLLGVGGWCWRPSSAIEAGQCGCGEPSAGGGELGVNKINIYIYSSDDQVKPCGCPCDA
jgi:hypothetical protein